MRCNKCSEPFGPSDQMALSKCDHVFCLNCAKEIVDAGEGCVVCGRALSKASFKVAVYQRDLSDARYMLCGQSPEFILQSCASALHFFQEQSRIEVARAAQEEMASFQQAVKAKLSEVHSAYKRYKARCSEFAEDQASMLRDRSELQEKYAHKTAQSRRLQEMCEKLQNENERLKKVRGAPFFEGKRPQASEDRQRMVPAPPRNRNSYRPEVYPKGRGSFLSHQPHQVSEESEGRRNGQRIVAASSAMRKRGSYQHQQAETRPRVKRAISGASSFQTLPRATVSAGFRASKRRIFEITNERRGGDWDKQWSINPGGSQGRVMEEVNHTHKDPFAINQSAFSYLN
ncbi:RING-type domain-containing protein [Chloropicon primus]|uniref:RING-type domain-containing protein n=1 Tax=Chloropicon primus TaxID=1764295 RepID=A0A5B8MIB5_9CHLO|nr:hypothetical protein A3770_03p27110 [Chloropicon primus]UPQ99403.1 RING-type domain-containing protein [Chloropicon primus]|eukprot:QDZ20193.1 hypothetical protein A3770_03p27110 [Chloropicon primus]